MSRNVTEPRGREIQLHEVLPYASPKCGTCRGTGTLIRRAPGEKRFATMACGCAAQAFDRAHPEAIILDSGHGYWPAVLPETRAFSPDGVQATAPAPGGAIPPPEVPTSQPVENAQPRPSPFASRIARLQSFRDAAVEELAAEEVRVMEATEAEQNALNAAEDLVLAQTQDMADLHHKVNQVGAQIAQLEEQLAALREVREHLVVQRGELSEALDASWSTVREAEERVKVAGAKFRPRVRKAQERLDQLDKRLARVKAEVGG